MNRNVVSYPDKVHQMNTRTANPDSLFNSTNTSRIISATAGAVMTSLLGIIIINNSLSHGIFALLVTPLDVVKVRMQSQPMFQSVPLSTSAHQASYVFCNRFWNHVIPCSCRTLYVFDRPASTLVPTARPFLPSLSSSSAWYKSPSTIKVLLNIGQREGWTALWKGLTPTLAMALPATIVYFVAYESLRDAISPLTVGVMAPLVAGSGARVVAATLISPLELFRTRLQHHQGTRGAWPLVIHELRKLVHENGWRSLYRGLVPTLWRDVPFSAIYWMCFERFKDQMTKIQGYQLDTNRENSWMISFGAGAMAGTIAATLTTPFDVAKTRRQVERETIHRSINQVWGRRVSFTTFNSQSRSMIQILGDIWKREGWRGLMLGWGPRLAKIAPACAIMVSTYDYGKAILKQQYTNGARVDLGKSNAINDDLDNIGDGATA